jgi:hypothetical protein
MGAEENGVDICTISAGRDGAYCGMVVVVFGFASDDGLQNLLEAVAHQALQRTAAQLCGKSRAHAGREPRLVDAANLG